MVAAPERVGLKPSESLRQLAMPVWERILAHPYLGELKAGTLPVETFRFYVQQDWLYLQEFTRAGAVIAGRCPDAESMKFMLTWVEPLVMLAGQLRELASSGPGSLDAYVRNAKLGLYRRARQVVLAGKPGAAR